MILIPDVSPDPTAVALAHARDVSYGEALRALAVHGPGAWTALAPLAAQRRIVLADADVARGEEDLGRVSAG